MKNTHAHMDDNDIIMVDLDDVKKKYIHILMVIRVRLMFVRA